MECLRFKNILNTISRTHIRDYHQPAHGRKCDLWPHPPFFLTLPEDSSSGFQVTALNFPLPTRPTCPLASAFPSWSAPFIYLSLKIHLFNEVFSRCLHGHTPGQVSVIHTDNEQSLGTDKVVSPHVLSLISIHSLQAKLFLKTVPHMARGHSHNFSCRNINCQLKCRNIVKYCSDASVILAVSFKFLVFISSGMCREVGLSSSNF